MAGHARYTAVLDACALYSAAVCDSLMSLAVAGLYAAKWTTAIEDEWMRNLETNRPELAGRLTMRRDAMRAAVADWEVEPAAWQALAARPELPDKDDAHVLAAAIAGHADCIVTFNLKDFPQEALAPFGIEALHPDDFILAQLDLDPFTAIAAFKHMRARRKRPQESAEIFAAGLRRNGLVLTAARLMEAAELI
jgi:predicted nucleic acid-binding protein